MTPIRLCLAPRCGSRAAHRGYCRDHAREREQRVGRAGKRVYNSKRWQQTRERVLFEQPLCECGAIATDVHHRQDIAAGGDLWARSNLVALCHACHSRRTRAEQLGGGRER